MNDLINFLYKTWQNGKHLMNVMIILILKGDVDIKLRFSFLKVKCMPILHHVEHA